MKGFILMAPPCPECGAHLHEGDSCQAIFDPFLALEFRDPAFGAVHFLSVACFMIQHGRYSDQGLIWIAGQLRAYLEEGRPIEYIRRRAAREIRSQVRSWKVSRSPEAPRQAEIPWSMTIAGVAGHYRDSGSYCELVTRWARTTLKEMQPLLDRV